MSMHKEIKKLISLPDNLNEIYRMPTLLRIFDKQTVYDIPDESIFVQ